MSSTCTGRYRTTQRGPVDQPFRVGIMLDGEVVSSRRISGLDAQDDTRGLNILIQVDFPGLHTLALIVDLDNDVAESSEADNVYVVALSWEGPTPTPTPTSTPAVRPTVAPVPAVRVTATPAPTAAPVEASAVSLATLTGRVLYSGQPIVDFTDVEPTPGWFWVRFLETGRIFPSSPTFDSSTGTYTIPDLPPGRYGVQIRFDAAEPFDGYPVRPGDFGGFSPPIVVESGDSVLGRDLQVQQVIHLTSPVDNIGDIGDVNEPKPTYGEEEVSFTWDPIAEATSYVVVITRYQEEPFRRLGTAWRIETFDTMEVPALLGSDEGEFYLLSLSGYNRGELVASLMISYTNGFGGDYRFRVVSHLTPQPTSTPTAVPSATPVPTTPTITPTPIGGDQVTLHSVAIEGDDLVVVYTKNFVTCVHPLADPFTQVTVQNHYCETGGNVSVTTSLSLFTGVEPGVELKLCHGNNYNICSDLVPVAPVPTPNFSGKIVFDSNRGGNIDIFAMNADGSNETRLTTDPATDSSPVWSPDGNKVAFRSFRGGDTEIYVMDADGSNQTNLTNNDTNDETPAWSPDGTKIVFQSDPDIYVMDADGSNRTNLTNSSAHDLEPAWSPDGNKIAFYSFRNSNRDIYIMDADGSNETRLTTDPASDYMPAWSPDGTKIAFTRAEGSSWDVWVIDVDGTDETRLTTDSEQDRYPAWSPDGQHIVFQSTRTVNGQVWVMNADGTGLTRLTNYNHYDFDPHWTTGSVPWVRPTPTPTPTPVSTLAVTKTQDTNDGVCDADCSLREAISAANPGTTVIIPAGTPTH